ncbi:MAG: hypothetical protein P8Z42_16830, partial [Anaerolineales bacterium]
MLKRLGSVSIFHVILAGIGCGFSVLAIFVVTFLLFVSPFGASGRGEVTIQVEPYLTNIATDTSTSFPTESATVPATETHRVAPPTGKIVYTCFLEGY